MTRDRAASPSFAGGVVACVIEVAPEHLGHDGARETARHQESHLFRALLRIGGWRVEAAAPQGRGALDFGLLQAGHRLRDGFGRDALGLQLLLHAQRARAGSTLVQHRGDHARLADEVLRGQLVERLRQRAGLFLVLGQLALQLRARMLALAQEAQGAAFEGGGAEGHSRVVGRSGGPRNTRRPLRLTYSAALSAYDALAGFSAFSGSEPASAASSGIPSDSRTLFSISRDRSGFSRRNSRALSRPWPIFSPL
eukprot:Opistho-1_new@95706